MSEGLLAQLAFPTTTPVAVHADFCVDAGFDRPFTSKRSFVWCRVAERVTEDKPMRAERGRRRPSD